MRTTIKKASKSGLMIGIGSVLNIIPVYGKPSSNVSGHPDAHILKSDWEKIGGDFKVAINKIK